MVSMGIGKIGGQTVCFKRQFRWLFEVPDISDDGTNALQPEKSARPSLNFKEIEVQHLNETVYFTGKPEWKPVNLTLFDVKKKANAIFQWLQKQYNPCEGTWTAPSPNTWKKQTAKLKMLDGCGNVLETWVYENVWPSSIEWGELDMGSSAYATVDLTLRYDRAYIEEEC